MFMIDSMHNKNFLGNQTKNGTGYCLWTGSACDLNSSSYQIDDDGMMISMDVISPPQKNIWESSDVVQSHRIGNSYEFMWMHLNKAPTSVTFNALKNASGIDYGPNDLNGESIGTPTSQQISFDTEKDEIEDSC